MLFFYMSNWGGNEGLGLMVRWILFRWWVLWLGFLKELSIMYLTHE